MGRTMIEIVPSSAAASQRIRLAGNLDVRSASNLQSALQDLLSQGKPGDIDCSQVESLDCACIQLLLAVARDAQGAVKVEFEPTSEVAKWFEYAGVRERLSASSGECLSLDKAPKQ